MKLTEFPNYPNDAKRYLWQRDTLDEFLAGANAIAGMEATDGTVSRTTSDMVVKFNDPALDELMSRVTRLETDVLSAGTVGGPGGVGPRAELEVDEIGVPEVETTTPTETTSSRLQLVALDPGPMVFKTPPDTGTFVYKLPLFRLNAGEVAFFSVMWDGVETLAGNGYTWEGSASAGVIDVRFRVFTPRRDFVYVTLAHGVPSTATVTLTISRTVDNVVHRATATNEGYIV